MTEEYEGKKQEWNSILEGELARAREIQAELPALRYREVEQAVFATFLHSQPVGQRALTRDLMLLLGHTQPDKIALEKGLRRWTEVSWFLDEMAIEDAEVSPTGGKLLPRTWRLGSRPNLKQMHSEARERVSSEVVEDKLLRAIESCKSLTAGASAAGAKPHVLPDKPSYIEDDAEFHYAILGPRAASRAGKPGDEARRFINEKTGSDNPRIYRNAIVLAVPSVEGIEAARRAIRDYQGWLEVESQLKGQDIDNNRRQLLEIEKKKAEKQVTEMVRQAYCIVVTVSDKNEVQAFKVVQSDDSPLFNIIKADKQARIKETAVTAEALLPSGPYDLWREGDTEHLVNDLASAFAHFAQLPKMLNRKAIFETLLDGCQQGLFVLRSNRKDGSFKTYWYEAPPLDTLNSKDFNFAVVLSEVATLASLPSHLLSPDVLPELWQGPELRLRDLYDYFSGGKFVKSGEYGETIAIPRSVRSSINEAIQAAVKEKRLWLLSGQASFLSEDVPLDFLTEDATLQAPPQPIPSRDIMPENLPEAWNGKDEVTALAIAEALSTKLGKVLPWVTVRDAISTALNARWLERAADSGPLSDYASAQAVKICQRKEQAQQQPEPRTEQPVTYAGLSSSQPGLLVAEAGLSVNELQDFYEKIGEILKAAAEINSKIAFRVRMELNASSQPPQDAVEKINKLLQEVSTELELRSN